MRLTIIAPDGTVGIDGEFRHVDLPMLDANIRALQWDGVVGHIEFNDDDTQNATIHDIDPFLLVVDAWHALTPLPPVPLTDGELQQQSIESIRAALQYTIDEKAKTLGFSGGNTLMLYAGFANAFQPLAQTFATWEASVWVDAETYKAQVIAGTQPMLTPNAAVLMMPDYPI